PASLILVSAKWSRSPVVIPGSTVSASSFRTAATIRPAALIFSISAFDFRIIILSTPGTNILSSGDPCHPQHTNQAAEHIHWISSPIHLMQAARLLVVFKDGLCLLIIKRQPLLYCLGPVIVANYQSATIQITGPIHFARLQIDIVSSPANRAGSPT